MAVEQGSWLHRDMTLPKWIEELQEEDIDWGEVEPCEEVVEKMQDEIKADYYFERGA